MELKAPGILKLIFIELFRFLKENDKTFHKTERKLPKSHSTSIGINTAGNETSLWDLDFSDEELVYILHDLH